jgi:hypothetical protein
MLLNQDSSAAPDDVCAICLVRTFFFATQQKTKKKNRETLDSSAVLDDVCAMCTVSINEILFFFLSFFFVVDTCGGRVHELQKEIFMQFGNSTFGIWALVFVLCKFCANLAHAPHLSRPYKNKI